MRKLEEKQQAYNLYFQTEFTQGEIAHLLQVSRKTVNTWVRENHWEKMKQSSRHLPAFVAEQCYYMLVNKTAHILGRSDCYPTEAEVNSIRKLSLTIKQLKNRQTTAESMETLIHLMDVVKAKDPALAQQLMPFVDGQVQKRVSFDYQEHFVDNSAYREGLKLEHKEQNEEDGEEAYNESIAMQMAWAEEHKHEVQQHPNEKIIARDARQRALTYEQLMDYDPEDDEEQEGSAAKCTMISDFVESLISGDERNTSPNSQSPVTLSAAEGPNSR